MMKNKLSFIILFSLILLSIYNTKSYASDTRINLGLQVMEYVFDKFGDCSFLVKYRKDKKIIGVLIISPLDAKANILKVFDCNDGKEVFEFAQTDKEITDFNFKKNAVVITYKSTFWQERAAYDLSTGRFVRRYSSLLSENILVSK